MKWILMAAATFAVVVLIILVVIASITGSSDVSIANTPGNAGGADVL